MVGKVTAHNNCALKTLCFEYYFVWNDETEIYYGICHEIECLKLKFLDYLKKGLH